MRIRRIFLGALAGLFLLTVAFQAFAQDGVIKERRALMKGNSKANKAIKKALKKKDYTTVEAKAKAIAAAMDKLPDLFPKGTTSEKSRAKAAIWEKWDKFDEKRIAMKTAAEELAGAAGAMDGDKVASLVKGFGKKCGSCHRSFRKKKKKKKM